MEVIGFLIKLIVGVAIGIGAMISTVNKEDFDDYGIRGFIIGVGVTIFLYFYFKLV